MNRLRSARLKLNPEKCRLFQLKTNFLGHDASGRRIEPHPEKVKAVVEWPTPRNLTEARGFVALASYYRRFVASFAEITRPIHLLTQKNQPFVWTDSQQTAFGSLKHCLVTAPVLSLACDDGRYVLDSDASDGALGLVLQHEQDVLLKVIVYASRALQPAERSLLYESEGTLGSHLWIKAFSTVLVGPTIRLPN